jgi:hypothetical protein
MRLAFGIDSFFFLFPFAWTNSLDEEFRRDCHRSPIGTQQGLSVGHFKANEIKKFVVTLWVMRHFLILPGAARACVDFCDPTADSRLRTWSDCYAANPNNQARPSIPQRPYSGIVPVEQVLGVTPVPFHLLPRMYKIKIKKTLSVVR